METPKIISAMRKVISPAIVWAIVLLIVSSCGYGGIGAFLAGGGISGTGRFSGIITGFGSVFVNGVEITTTNETSILIDDVSDVESNLKVGMKVQVEANNNIASSIVYKSEIRGPIETGTMDISSSSFSVLGQTVIADGTTVYEGISGFAALKEGDIVEISGFADAGGNILATFVKLEDAGLTEFKIKGTVSNLDEHAGTFFINDITVDYSGVQISISDGDSVEVKGVLDVSVNKLIASEIETGDSSFNSGDEVELEGVVISLTSQSDFVVNSQRVQTTSQTIYEHGTASNIAENVRVEIKGTVNNSDILIAKYVEFRFIESESQEIDGLVSEVDIDGSTLLVDGTIVHVDLNTVFKDEDLRFFNLEDIRVGDHVEISGFYDNTGNLIAAKLERDNDSE